ncbi:MAG: pyridoxal-phosphate dependent enzyme, partial [Saprospiraceae bacterium]
MSLYLHLECQQCKTIYSKIEINSYCPKCTQPLVARYQLHKSTPKDIIHSDRYDMWRYAKLLPIENEDHIVNLGEGWTPLLHLPKSVKKYGLASIWLKEEGLNPTGSFKARGIGMAISKGKELGITSFCIPTAGNAGNALAAYTA